ncbi:uncharacterized protein SPSK_11017 [Sporothrix schenckii 1099-18]|uniref:Uncharacterized protein n=1 Tax=Sporothrix schenckii 1099-18 TaxID=1397361 RepID=A0A0F2M673_SPOSC|nr:uncharacterized protein SPSK_11017 [Sporothrix schenckii 1099-18]KJR84589.1 hypothetical protein SPSK_11017 [Sporothrix schenckii 1099-18]
MELTEAPSSIFQAPRPRLPESSVPTAKAPQAPKETASRVANGEGSIRQKVIRHYEITLRRFSGYNGNVRRH